MNRDYETDEQMKEILDVLNQIPQQEIPPMLAERLHGALKAEGEAIRREKAAHKGILTRKRIYRGLATLAACFVVGFISISMYNNMGTGIDGTALTETGTAPKQNVEMESDGEAADDDLYGAADTGGTADEETVSEWDAAYTVDETEGATQYTPEERADASAEALESATPESRNCSTTRNAVDAASGASPEAKTYRNANTFDQETLSITNTGDLNLARIETYLGTSDFTVVSVMKDAKTGETVYKVLLAADAEETASGETRELVMSEGEVYERQSGE